MLLFFVEVFIYFLVFFWCCVFLVLCFFGVVIVDFVVPLLPLILIFLFLFFLFKFFMFSVLCVDLTFISIYKYIVPVTT